MRQIITTMVTIVFFMIGVLTITSVITANVQYETARDLHSVIIDQIESSNFSPSVMKKCQDYIVALNEKKKTNYKLDIYPIDMSDNTIYEVDLTYTYSIPFLMRNIEKPQVIMGYAR